MSPLGNRARGDTITEWMPSEWLGARRLALRSAPAPILLSATAADAAGGRY
jgi:hypothetical protein